MRYAKYKCYLSVRLSLASLIWGLLSCEEDHRFVCTEPARPALPQGSDAGTRLDLSNSQLRSSNPDLILTGKINCREA